MRRKEPKKRGLVVVWVPIVHMFAGSAYKRFVVSVETFFLDSLSNQMKLAHMHQQTAAAIAAASAGIIAVDNILNHMQKMMKVAFTFES